MGKDLGIMEVSMVNMYIKYKMWKYKLAGILPNIDSIIRDVQYWKDNLSSFNKWGMMLPPLVRQLWNV